jgi:hypothetical protein
MSENTEYEQFQLAEQIAAQRDYYETLLSIAQGSYLAEDHDDKLAFEWLEANGYDVDNYSGELVDCAADALAEGVLELVGQWEGASKDEAEYKGCRVVVCVGGPHVELDTARSRWIGYWGGHTVSLGADPETVAYFDSLVSEQ